MVPQAEEGLTVGSIGPPRNTLKACSPLHLNFRPLDFPSGPVWLGLHAPNAGGLASTPGPGIRSHILHIRSGAAKYIKIRSNNNKINLRPTTHLWFPQMNEWQTKSLGHHSSLFLINN